MIKRFESGRKLAAVLLALPLVMTLAGCASPEDSVDGLDESAPVEESVEVVPGDEGAAGEEGAESDEGSEGEVGSEGEEAAAEVLGCAAFVEDEELFVTAADVAAAVDDPNCLPDELVFVDARPTLDYQSGHIPDAINAPYHSVAGYLNELPTDKWLVVYCECPRAEAVQAARALTGEHGYTKVKVIGDGLGGWRELGREIVGSVQTDS